MLTDHQLTHFNTFGFVRLPGLFSQEEIKNFNDEFQLKLESTLRFTSDRDEPAKFSSWSNLGAETPHLSRLVEDPRLLNIARQLLGEDCVLRCCNSGSYVNETPWHPDSSMFHEHTVKFPIYLQSLDETNGALRLIPGSHKKAFHDVVTRFGPGGIDNDEARKIDEMKETPAHVCKTEPGDVYAFECHIWHASWGGGMDRRMISPIYSKNPKTPEEEEAVREQVKLNFAVREDLAKNTYAERQPEYPLEWLANPENNPLRQRWIDWLHKWKYIESFQDTPAKN